MNQPQFTVDLGKSFNLITFVGEREEAEMMISKGWTPVWAPGTKAGEMDLPHYSDYFILVWDNHPGK
ncbi:hypothetical protein [Oceanobacillus sp. Castelsardo]|uniref:hypothetical protein n=1 Tax=Oceanobacillus sp. Castelsardo TaxID=1851204 RepID=UPI0008398940|nr:hypothetical protein [Oceanobacillus sp. Castelsardo]